MSGIATAIAGAAVLGSISSRNASRRAADSERQGQEQATAFQAQADQQARSDAIPLFQGAQQNQLAGFGSALDIFNQSIPQQQQVFQQGNVGAQNALLAGLPQFQNAILGNPVNFDAFQPQTLDIPQFQPAELPQFTSINESLGLVPQPTQQPAPQPQFQGPYRGLGFNYDMISPGRHIP